jgi:hypothetical protein
MGNLLDDLLRGSTGVTVAWDPVAEPFPTRPILRFDESFSVEDTGDEIKIGIRFVGGLDGNVIGDTDENIVVAIDGDEDGANVIMRAQSLTWNVAELVITGEEALAIRHNDLEVFAGIASAPRLGNATSISELRGGQRFATRVVNTSVATLDTTTTDMLVHVIADTERSITLPPASDGRTIIFLIAGGSTVTLKRAGSDLINGSASNYIVPFADACVVLSSVGGNWLARSFADAAGMGGGSAEVPITRRIDTSAPLTGGGDFSADRTLGIDTSGLVSTSRTITATPPLTGGGDLSANRSIGIDTSGLVPTTRTLTTSSPLTGGGPLDVDRTLGIDPLGYVAPTRTITVTSPLTGGGDLSADRTIGINTAGFVGVARLINTAAPLTGGGSLNSDLTLAVSGATAAALGVVQLAGNLGGTAAAPTVTGLKADTIPVQDASGTNKGVWSTVGLRIGDNTSPTEKLEVAGNINLTGFIKLGTNPAASGQIRLPNNAAIVARNGANTVDVQIAAVSASNVVTLGQSAQPSYSTDILCGSSGSIRLAPNGTTQINVGATVNTLGTGTIGNSLVGFQQWQTRTVAANHTIDTTTKDTVVFVDTTAAIRIITMPAASAGRIIIVKRKTGSNRVEINLSGGSKLDGIAISSVFLLTDAAGSAVQPYIELQSDGTDWFIARHFSIQINLP